MTLLRIDTATSASGSAITLDSFGGHVLATRQGISLLAALLFAQGALCEKCGYGTRATSKNWARCKKCGHRNRRRTIEQVEAEARTRARLAFYCRPE